MRSHVHGFRQAAADITETRAEMIHSETEIAIPLSYTLNSGPPNPNRKPTELDTKHLPQAACRRNGDGIPSGRFAYTPLRTGKHLHVELKHKEGEGERQREREKKKTDRERERWRGRESELEGERLRKRCTRARER